MFQKVKLAGVLWCDKETDQQDGDVGEDPQGDQRCEEGHRVQKRATIDSHKCRPELWKNGEVRKGETGGRSYGGRIRDL